MHNHGKWIPACSGMTKPLLGLAICSALVSGSALAQDAKLGTWRLDPAASQMPGPPAREDERRYDAQDDGRVLSVHVVIDAAGRRSETRYLARDDGQEVPMVDDQGRELGTIALWRIDAATQRFITRREGKVTARGITRVLSQGRDLRLDIVPEQDGARGTPVVTLFHRANLSQDKPAR